MFVRFAAVVFAVAVTLAQPRADWPTSTPEAQGLDSATLADAFDYIRTHHTRIHSFLLVRNGHIVLDAHFYPYRSDELHDVASVTKSVTSTLVATAIADGTLKSVDQPLLGVFGDGVSNVDDRKRRLTLRHLLTMTSGLDCRAADAEITLREMQASPDWVRFMLDRPMVAQPGSQGEYCSGGMHVLSGVLSRTTGTSAFEFARRRLFGPLGIRDVQWPADPQGVTTGWGDLHLHPHDMAKLGYLWLNNGRWEDRQILPSGWMDEATTPQSHVIRDDYGYGFWVYPRRTPPIYEALGRGGQRISVIPAANLIVVLTGGTFEPGEVGEFIGKAIKSDRALPDNAVAATRLALAVADAARPPAAAPATALPAKAGDVSGRRFVLDANPLNIQALTFTFRVGATATARFEFANGRTETRDVGLDGVPRVSPNGRFGLPVALGGAWIDASTFTFDYDEVANINCFVYRISFDDGGANVAITERSGLVRLTLRAHR